MSDKETKKRSLSKMATDFKALKSIAETSGLKGNDAVIAANKAMIKTFGENPLEEIDRADMKTEQEEYLLMFPIPDKPFTTAEAAELWGMKLRTAQRRISLLVETGMLNRHIAPVGKPYIYEEAN